jgi:hypothetical protein
MYARTDIGGLFKYNASSNNWSELLDAVTPSNGQQMGVLSLAIDPTNPNNLYLDTGQYTGTDGWVLRSTNGGASFTSTRLSFYVGGNSDGRATGERLAIDPNDPSILFLGSNNDGLWETTNSAASFSQVTSFPAAAGSSGITFVTYNPTGAAGSPSQSIFVGVDSTAAGSNLYQTTNGGTTWTEVAGTNAPTGLIPDHGQRASDGNWYFTYANATGPDTSPTTGAVERYNPVSGVWTSISPVVPGAVSGDTFGYEGLAVDPENPGTVVVTSLDRYNQGDQIWRTTNASAATPTWTAMYTGTATRITSSAPWISKFTDGIGNWAATAAIDPFNTDEVLYGDGQGLWETTNAASSPVNWTFNDTGIEFTSALHVAAPPSGTLLLSALGDINGFAHTTLASSPAQGATLAGGKLGTDNSIDFAYANPNDQVLIGAPTNGGAYSTNDGQTWTAFAAAPVSAGTTGTAGAVAMSASGSAIVWATSNAGVFYSTNNGSSWTLSTGSPGNSAQVVADRQNASDFYCYLSGKMYVSTNGGATFTAAATGLPGSGNLAASPYTAGTLWLGTSSGLYQSTNFGASFSKIASGTVTAATEVAIGAPAAGSTTPAIYIWGIVAGLQDLYRSTDGGNTWIQINDSAHQWGGGVQTLAADPVHFGRVYLGINGRGVIMGSPQFASINGGVLSITFASAGDAISLAGTGSGSVTVTLDQLPLSFTGVTAISVDFASTSFALNLSGALTAPLTLANSAAATLSLAGSTTATLAAPDASGVTAIPLAQLSIGATASLTVAASTTAADRAVLSLGGLTLAGSMGDWLGKLDLTDNDLIVSSATTPAAAALQLTQITNQIATGLDDGAWDGNGIVSSAAAALPSRLMSLGVLINADSNGNALYGNNSNGPFDSQDPSPNAVLVKYTLLGDADLNGVITTADYLAIDNGYHLGETGWANGDFNYDNTINGDDYSLIDNSFNVSNSLQSANAAIAAPAVSAAVQSGAPATVESPAAAPSTVVNVMAATPAVAFAAIAESESQWIDQLFDAYSS